MTVKELVEFLKQQPQDLPVIYQKHSEYKLLEVEEIESKHLSKPRPDGWVHTEHVGISQDFGTQDYLVFPGN